MTRRRKATLAAGTAAGGAAVGAGLGRAVGIAGARRIVTGRADGAKKGRRLFSEARAIRSLRKLGLDVRGLAPAERRFQVREEAKALGSSRGEFIRRMLGKPGLRRIPRRAALAGAGIGAAVGLGAGLAGARRKRG